MAFDKSQETPFLTYRLTAELTETIAHELAADVRLELGKNDSLRAVVFDLQRNPLNYRTFRIFSPLGLELRKADKHIYALSRDERIHSLIRTEGMEGILRPVKSMAEVRELIQPAKVAPKIDVSFVNPFVEGTVHVLKVQCQTTVSTEKPRLKTPSESAWRTDIAGIIGITSRSFTGSIALCFSEKVFLTIISRMLGESFTELNDELADGAAELLNMIFGHAKKILNERGHTIEKALPSVVRGSGLKLDHSSPQGSIILPFKMEDDFFFMEIGLENH